MQQVLQDSITAGTSLMVVSMVDKMLPPSKSDLEKYLRQGLMWSLADEMADYVMTGQTQLMNGDYWGYADKTLFNGGVNWAIDETKVAQTVYTELANVSPLPDQLNQAFISGAFKVGATSLANMIDRQWSNTALKYATHPTLFFRM